MNSSLAHSPLHQLPLCRQILTFTLMLAACGGTLAPAIAQEYPLVTVETLTGVQQKPLEAVILGDEPKMKLSGQTLPLRDVLRVEFQKPISFRRELQVTLADGSLLFGGLGPDTDDSNLSLNGRLFPDGVSIPLEWIRRIDYTGIAEGSDAPLPPRPARPEKSEEDTILTREGAKLAGLLAGVSATEITFEDKKLGELKLPWSKIRSIGIAELDAAPTLPAESVAVTLEGAGGSYLHGALQKLDANRIELASPLLGPVILKRTAVSGIEFRLGRVEYLSTRDPIRVEEHSTEGFGFHWPWQRDRNVFDGGPLQIGDRVFRRGLGVHSVCHLVFAIEPEDQTFQSWIGIDVTGRPANDDPELGSVVFVVRVDGVEKFRSGDVNWEQRARQIEVDVKGAKELELVVEAGKKYIVLDRANWGDARLLKK